jgi:transcriptional regulator with XRE-family HTH domain
LKNDLLRKARLDHGWTQERLAEELNVGVETIRSWENGRRSPGIVMRNRLCEIFGMTAAQLGLVSEESGMPTVPLNDLLDASEQDAPQPINDLLDVSEQDAPQPINDLLDVSEQDAPQPINDLLDASEQDAPQPINGLLDVSEQDAPQPINDLLDASEQDAPQGHGNVSLHQGEKKPIFKKKKTIGEITRMLAVFASILSFLILIINFIVPKPYLAATGNTSLSSPTPTSGKGSTPSPTSTSSPTPTSGKESTSSPTPTLENEASPSPTSSSRLPITPTRPPSSPIPTAVTAMTDLGPLDIQDYCHSIGESGAILDQNNAYGWRCIEPSGNHVLVNTDQVCQWQYTQPNILSRLVNYSNPNDWHCYSHVRRLGGVNFAGYCQFLGLKASLYGKTAYDWRCIVSSTDNWVLIDVDAACRWQYSESDALSSVANYFDPNGWICLGKA